MKGYLGKLLDINLSNESYRVIELDTSFYEKYIGGRGLGARLLYDMLPAGIDPLSHENIMLVLTGPLTGTIVPGAGKFVVVSKSPVSGGFLDSYSSGRIAVEIKFAGYDGLIIRSKASKPSYIFIEDEKVEIRDASDLWGQDTFATEEMLQQLAGGKEVGTMCIGPAGENLVNFASINSDYYRQAARGGIGAVMGSKNLKAIAVRGTKGVRCADTEGLMELVLKHKEMLDKSPVVQNRIKYGTPSTLDITNEVGMLPTKNFQTGVFEKARGVLDGEGVRSGVIQSRGCYGCMIACSKITKVKEGEFKDALVEGPEYETVGLLGSNVGVDYLPAIIQANILCDRLGLDTISTGNVIGFAMECYERGLLPEKYTNGLQLNFGNYHAVLRLIEDIAYRRGFGDILARGVKGASEAIGGGSSYFAMHVKGLEFPAYDPRIGLGTALSYAVSPRGACHRRAWPPSIEVLGHLEPYEIEGKAGAVKKLVDENSVFHSMLVCDFPAKWVPLKVKDFAEYLTLAVGRRYSEKELWEAAERIETQIRLFNIREGLTRKDDTLPPRVFKDALLEGPTKGNVVAPEQLEKLLDDYYELRGWEKDGTPKMETLVKLGLPNV
ncbi:MAG TPA: aldehyde ferredoxin oxidoreductase family protein [Thermoanaerobacterales bacterium]|nr:aldehyde ferredoxin oxidoreductase family protein [Thermoanaerobacterales bacterium]